MAKNPNRIRMSLGDRLFGIVNFAIVTILIIMLCVFVMSKLGSGKKDEKDEKKHDI